MLRMLPKMLSEISHNFTYYALQVFPLCLHCVPKLATILAIILAHFISKCSIRVFHYRVTVLLENISIYGAMYSVFECSIAISTDCSISEY